ncbi:hypothetical protein A2U01_0038055, partial [Trifolium medium]|nr:hypothetical protein [Trifolium medium]
MDYILKGELPHDVSEAALVKRRGCTHSIIEGKLYKRRLSTPLLKCLSGDEAA